MSHHHQFLTSGFLRTPLKNGIGRHVCQLQRLTIKFCKTHGSSIGIRKFIETELLDYTKENPGIVVYLKPRRHRNPVLVAEYLNGNEQQIHCVNYTKDECAKWINLLKTQSGNEIIRFRKYWHTDNPSIQGPWTPFTNREPEQNTYNFPEEHLKTTLYNPPSATDQLVEIFKKTTINEETKHD